MPLYEVELRGATRKEERLTDRPLAVGETTRIGGRAWVVATIEPAHAPRNAWRFICVEPAKAPNNPDLKEWQHAARLR